MHQTLLALCAILTFAYLALGRQHHDQSVDRHAQAVEAELAAVDVARAQMSAMTRLAFDEEDLATNGIRTEPSGSTLGADAGETGPAFYDDVDDWRDAPAWTEAVPVGMGTLTFRVAVAVRYVQDRRPTRASTKPTLTKEIVVSVVEVPDGELARPPATATLTRAVTPAGVASTLR